MKILTRLTALALVATPSLSVPVQANTLNTLLRGFVEQAASDLRVTRNGKAFTARYDDDDDDDDNDDDDRGDDRDDDSDDD